MHSTPEPIRPDPLETERAKALLQAGSRKAMQLFWWLIGCQGFIMLGLVGAVVFLLAQNASSNAQASQLISSVRQGAISSCLSGNAARATNKQIWYSFLNLILTNPQAPKEKASLEAVVANAGLPAPEVQVFDAILNSQYTVSSDTTKLVTQFESYISEHEPAQNCAKIYGSLGRQLWEARSKQHSGQRSV